MDQLPNEIIIYISKFLNVTDYCNLRSISVNMRTILPKLSQLNTIYEKITQELMDLPKLTNRNRMNFITNTRLMIRIRDTKKFYYYDIYINTVFDYSIRYFNYIINNKNIFQQLY